MSGGVEGDWIWGKESRGQEPQPVPPFHWMPQKAWCLERKIKAAAIRVVWFVYRSVFRFLFFFFPSSPSFFKALLLLVASLPRSALPQTRGARIALQRSGGLWLIYIYMYIYICTRFWCELGLFFTLILSFLVGRVFFFLCRLVLSDRIKDLICMMECIEVLLLCFGECLLLKWIGIIWDVNSFFFSVF